MFQTYNKKTQIYILRVHPNLTEGATYELYMDFVSVLNDLLQGFYRSKYIDSNSKQKRYVSTNYILANCVKSFKLCNWNLCINFPTVFQFFMTRASCNLV